MCWSFGFGVNTKNDTYERTEREQDATNYPSDKVSAPKTSSHWHFITKSRVLYIGPNKGTRVILIKNINGIRKALTNDNYALPKFIYRTYAEC